MEKTIKQLNNQLLLLTCYLAILKAFGWLTKGWLFALAPLLVVAAARLAAFTVFLPRGYGQVLADEFGCSVSKVYHVVTGQLTDYRILEALLDIIERNAALERRLERRSKTAKTKEQ